MGQFLIQLYKDRLRDPRGTEIILKLVARLLKELPTDVPSWTKFFERNLKLTEELENRIQNRILRTTLKNRNDDTAKLLKKLQSGRGTLKDIREYNARTVRELTEALERLRDGRNDG